MKKTNSINKCLLEIKEEFHIEINDNNYMDIIIEEIFKPQLYVDYIKEYMEGNQKLMSLEWAVWFYLFLKYTRQKDVDKMEKYASKLMRYPSNFFVEFEMAEMNLFYYGNVFKARDQFLKALKLIPEDSVSNHRLSIIYFYLGMVDKSIKFNRAAIENAHNSYEPSETKARCLFNIAVNYINVYENYAEAKKMLEEALEEMPDYPQAKAALKQLKGVILCKER